MGQLDRAVRYLEVSGRERRLHFESYVQRFLIIGTLVRRLELLAPQLRSLSAESRLNYDFASIPKACHDIRVRPNCRHRRHAKRDETSFARHQEERDVSTCRLLAKFRRQIVVDSVARFRGSSRSHKYVQECITPTQKNRTHDEWSRWASIDPDDITFVFPSLSFH